MHTPTQLVPTGARSDLRGQRRSPECHGSGFRKFASSRSGSSPLRTTRSAGWSALQRTTAPGSALNHNPSKGSSLMTFTGHRRVVATILAVASMALPASAWADTLPSSYRSDAAQSESAGTLPSTDRSDAAQSGWEAAARPPRSSSTAQRDHDRVHDHVPPRRQSGRPSGDEPRAAVRRTDHDRGSPSRAHDRARRRSGASADPVEHGAAARARGLRRPAGSRRDAAAPWPQPLNQASRSQGAR